MKATFPLAGLNLSGGIRIITYIVNGLAQNGHEVKLVVPDYAAKSHFQLDERVELQIVPTRGRGIWKKIYYFLKLCFIAVEDSDVCFATGYKTPYHILCSKIFHRSNAQLVYLIQAYEPLTHVIHSNKHPVIKRLMYPLAKFSYRLPFKGIAVSHWIKDQIGDDTILIINNGVNLEVFSQSSEIEKREQFTIGVIGSSAHVKGYDIFLQAMKMIGRDKGMKVLVASQEKLELPQGILSELIKPKGDKQLVRFYQQCDVFVFSSLVEGFSLPPLEAMACGIPVITTDCGGIRDYVNDLNAVIISPGDARSIANAIMRLKENEDLRSRLRQQGLKTARMFSLEMMISQYCEVLKRSHQT